MPEPKATPKSEPPKDYPKSWVKAGDPNRVGVSERHPQHPPSEWYPNGGEVHVVGDRVVQVAETPLVRLQLASKTLVRVEGPAARGELPAEPQDRPGMDKPGGRK